MPAASNPPDRKMAPFLLYLEWAARREALATMLADMRGRLASRRLRSSRKRLAARRMIDILLGFKATAEQDINKILLSLEKTGRES